MDLKAGLLSEQRLGWKRRLGGDLLVAFQYLKGTYKQKDPIFI